MDDGRLEDGDGVVREIEGDDESPALVHFLLGHQLGVEAEYVGIPALLVQQVEHVGVLGRGLGHHAHAVGPRVFLRAEPVVRRYLPWWRRSGAAVRDWRGGEDHFGGVEMYLEC